jgi:two-component system, chemotaxis family, CheB/CheR fusion protein
MASNDQNTEQLTAAALETIFRLVKARTGHDFSSYKKNTVLRRIERRLSLHDLDGIAGYPALLEANPQEAEALCREILIGVTSFFRDPAAFEAVKRDIVPRLLSDRKPDEPIRIWHPCCATGEEVYSMAMLIRECLDAAGADLKVQFFATDLDETAIAQARAGLYCDEAVAELSEDRLQRFFVRVRDQWQVSKQLRESVIFAQHSLIKDPPFSRLDLLVCRNFLIYITSDLQKRLVSLFHQVLKPGRFLFLGAAETVGHGSELFATVDKKWKIYQRLEVGRRGEFPLPFTAAVPGRAGRSAAPGPQTADTAPAALAEKLLASRYLPPHVMVNDRYEVLYCSPGADRFLHVPAGHPTRDLLKMAREELRPTLRAAIYKAFSDDEEVVFRGVSGGADRSRVNLVVAPVGAAATGRQALVVFEPVPPPAGMEEGESRPTGDEACSGMLVRQLEEQLRITHEQLIAVTEQLESSHEGFLSANEELMSINEEFQSANEELQSTNEELETSKEELQALNEELVTVNAELQEKVAELDQAHSDVENLLTSSDIATIFLDPQLQIKRYTPAMAAIFNLIPADIGRPFSHFAAAVDWALALDAETVLKERRPIEREVAASGEGRHYLMRVLPYRSGDDAVDGIVVTLFDLTERKLMEDALQLAKEEWERTFDAVPDLIAIIDGEHRIVRANRAMAQRLATTPEECSGRHCYRSAHCSDGPDRDCPHSLTLTDGREHRVELREEKLGGDFLVTTTPLFDEFGCITGSVHVARDITQRKRAEQELIRSNRESEQRLAQLQVILDHLSDGVVICALDGDIYHWNPAAIAMHGFSSLQECRRKLSDFDELLELRTEEDGIIPLERWPLARVLAGETLHGWQVELRRRDIEWQRVFSYGGTLARDKNGDAILAVLSITDITDIRRSHLALQENQRRLGLALDAGRCAPWEVDLVTGRHSWDNRVFEALRVPPERRDEAEQHWSAFVLPEDCARVMSEFAISCRRKAPYHSEFRMRSMDGEIRWYACHGRIVNEQGGRRMVGVLQDITERKVAEGLIRSHVEELEAGNRELTRFNKVSVGRELRMIALKKEINELCARLGEQGRYALDFEEQF